MADVDSFYLFNKKFEPPKSEGNSLSLHKYEMNSKSRKDIGQCEILGIRISYMVQK
jgi:hypothetical protein